MVSERVGIEAMQFLERVGSCVSQPEIPKAVTLYSASAEDRATGRARTTKRRQQCQSDKLAPGAACCVEESCHDESVNITKGSRWSIDAGE
jgi:hypothetical protein